MNITNNPKNFSINSLNPITSITTTNSVTITGQKEYIYEPQEDVTNYELALLIAVFSMINSNIYNIENFKYWDKVKRHFKVKGI